MAVMHTALDILQRRWCCVGCRTVSGGSSGFNKNRVFKVFHEAKSLLPSAVFKLMTAVESGMPALIPAFLRSDF
jgi:hypothetical protein